MMVVINVNINVINIVLIVKIVFVWNVNKEDMYNKIVVKLNVEMDIMFNMQNNVMMVMMRIKMVVIHIVK
jgi:hypothetical protein